VTNCEITNNTIKNGGNGIHLVSSSSNTIKYNTVKDNSVGIYLSSSDSNIIRDNSIQNNDNYGISLSSTSNNNIIYLNDFSHEMGSNARDLSTSNSWSHINQGNYWDDYNDYDSNGNGVGDNPYVIDGDSQDDHPMGVFLNQDPVAYIDSISPSPATQGQTINFKGNGIDDGTIIDWEWTSSVNGNFGSSEDVSYLGLSVGTHTIKFRVKDDDYKWSEYAERTLTINPLGSSQENQKPTATIIKPNPTTAI
jgi:parallel beta-helix repeat protein